MAVCGLEKVLVVSSREEVAAVEGTLPALLLGLVVAWVEGTDGAGAEPIRGLGGGGMAAAVLLGSTGFTPATVRGLGGRLVLLDWRGARPVMSELCSRCLGAEI